MAKQMGEVSLKSEEEALYANKSNGKRHNNCGTKKEGEKKHHQGKEDSHQYGASKNHGNIRKFDGKCYNWGKIGHLAKHCWFKRELIESNCYFYF